MRNDSDLTAVRWHAGVMNNGLIFGLAYHMVTRLPRVCSYGLGYVVAWVAYRLMRDGTRALIDNLRVVRPDASPRELERLALLTFRSYVRDTTDFIRSLSMGRERLEKLVAQFDADHFDALRAEGHGVIIVGGHFGNWELGGVALRLLRDAPLTVIGKAEASPVVGRFRRMMRESLNIETLEIGQMLDTALKIRRLLAANGVVAMLLDRHIGRDQVEVTFFGRRTLFLRTPAMIAHLSGAPLLPSFMMRQPDNRFLAVCTEPIRLDTRLPPDEAVQHATQAIATTLERYIREYPQLWYQFYPYFGGQPIGTGR